MSAGVYCAEIIGEADVVMGSDKEQAIVNALRESFRCNVICLGK